MALQVAELLRIDVWCVSAAVAGDVDTAARAERESGASVSESRIPNREFRIPNPEFRIPNPEFRIPNSESRIPNPGRLTAEDYIEIQQLVARYPYALDQNPDEGLSYANLFTPDAVFRQPRTEGRQNLATMASRAPHGAKYTRHFLANHVIEATTDGTVGKQYLVAVDIGESGQPSSIFLGGHYEDVYAKTPEGWRFNTRTFIASATGAEAK